MPSQRQGASTTKELSRKAMKELGIPVPKTKPPNNGMGRPQDELSKQFRISTRKVMLDEEIQRLIKARVISELNGSADVRIFPTIAKIAAGSYYKRPESPTGQAKNELHLHLSQMSDDQLRSYVAGSKTPQAQIVENAIDVVAETLVEDGDKK